MEIVVSLWAKFTRALFQTSSAASMRSLTFWNFTKRGIVVVADVSGQYIGPNFKGRSVQEE